MTNFKKFFQELEKAVDKDEELHEQVREFLEKMRTPTYQEAVRKTEIHDYLRRRDAK
jgi:hypothetical protein